jgi:RimJ/RimL family protein N-acetyltransferase
MMVRLPNGAEVRLRPIRPDDKARLQAALALVGVARSVRLAEAPDTAEWAIVVGDEWQGQGLGGALAQALADAARGAGIRRIAAVMLGDNAPARRVVLRIARRLAGDTPAVVDNHVHDGVRELTVEIAA